MKPPYSGSRRRKPQRQPGPGLDPVCHQRRIVDPARHDRPAGRAGALTQRVDERPHRAHAGRAAGIERDRSTLPSQRHRSHAARSRASMNWIGRSGGAGTTAASARSPSMERAQEARDPVGEAVGRVVRADDEPRAHDQRALAECRANHVLAGRLQRAVVRQDVLGRRVGERCDRRRFVETRAAGVRVDRHRRDERVVADAIAQACRLRPPRSAARSRSCRRSVPLAGRRAPGARARCADRDCR